jgi:wyosine [tRNA(Phe)-imidazoG37] synthetase (radical SAM superfamily)
MISFGPVPSRRLGKSLGVNNIIAPKTCSFDCVYCQVGRTMRKSIKRVTFFEPDVIYKNVEQHLSLLKPESHPDYITIVSNGEPTLDINLGKTIKLLKRTGIPVAVITNASLLIYDSVKEDLHQADWISLKVDAAINDTWCIINRPDKKLDFEEHLKSIILFAGEYKGILHTESMIVDGVNDSSEHFTRLTEIIKKTDPHKAYLSIPVRPPAEKWIKQPDADKLNMVWQAFNNRHIRTELLTGFEGLDTGSTGNIYEDILNITAVHPLREDSLLELLEKDNADFHVIESLIEQKLIRSTIYKGKRFFMREYHFNT